LAVTTADSTDVDSAIATHGSMPEIEIDEIDQIQYGM